MDVVVVESPAKAKTINKYLGADFIVLPSYGHVRDLPPREGSVRPDDDFAMTYEIDPKADKHLGAIARAARGAQHLYLATDPDREGEAISWHVLKALEERDATKGVAVKRVVFNEITERAVLEAMRHPRDLDLDLINAQQARRALDYLVGFGLSPVLWRKLPGARSAGRVQSVALRLICDRALEIEAFVRQEYWTIDADFRTADGVSFGARLVTLADTKLDKFALTDEAAAEAAVAEITGAAGFGVSAVESKERARHPRPPFTTSTLQQEASRKLGLRPRRTMDIAQRLYEGIDIGSGTVGLITYMRTDGVQIAREATAAARGVIGEAYGAAYVPDQPRGYKSTARNAQEAHEAIRPTGVERRPEHLARYLDADQRRLYELIWKRTVASQMASARIGLTAIDIADASGRCAFRTTGSVILFDGFLRLYQEGRDDVGEDEDQKELPQVAAGDALEREGVRPSQHFTEPPPRYTEATLVKRLEELGIGRPSTYASILSVLQERDYVRLEKGRFEPEDRGRLVTAFLGEFFRRYVEYDFTADLETRLDDISAGKVAWTQVLRDFWQDFKPAIEGMGEVRVRDVLEALNEILGPHIFPARDSEPDPRRCPSCAEGRLSLKVGRYGAFVGCSNYPECRHTRRLALGEGGAEAAADEGPREIGQDPESGAVVTLRQGPYGPYVQLGDGDGGSKPKRVALPPTIALDEVDLGRALALLALPREIGHHPESGKTISAGIGRYGPYLRHDGAYAGLGVDDDVLTIGLNRAVTLLAAPRGRGGRSNQLVRSLGDHPSDGKPVNLMKGRFGLYVTHGGVNAGLPKESEGDEIALDEAVALVQARASAKGGRRTRKPAKGATRRRRGTGGGSATPR